MKIISKHLKGGYVYFMKFNFKQGWYQDSFAEFCSYKFGYKKWLQSYYFLKKFFEN